MSANFPTYWMLILWIPLIIILKVIKPGMPTWLFLLFLLLDILLLIDRTKLALVPMSEYTLALILIAQPVIIFINRNKRKLADDVVTKQPVFHQATVPPIPAKNIFEQPPVSPIGKKNIFINYRKEDSSGYSLALYHELIKWYHKDTIFKDFNTIEPGEDFEEAINSALNGASVLIVIMADKWHDILQMRGQKKHKDFVRIEIATALAKNIYTIPVTINSTVMPTEEELPEDLVKLSHRQFLNIDQTRFETDILKLVKIIDGRLGIKRS